MHETTREALVERVGRLKWVHRIDLGHGVVTPGLWNPNHPVILRALDDIDFRGKKVLDIGCWDGLWSFEAERRGAARVYATDLVSQRVFRGQPTFRLAHKVLRSRVRYRPNLSVYDVERLGVRDFDVVIYAGVYYHVKDPLRSFSALRRVMKDGGLLLVEGATLDEDGCFARYYYREIYKKDRSNWWVPTVECLKEWVESSYFDEVRTYDVWDAGGRNLRTTMVARAVRRADPHYIRPDEELRDFDLNQYREAEPVGADRNRGLRPSRLFRSLLRNRNRGGLESERMAP
jgi:tRNA (mo5U34)-methyltransferase